MPTNPERLWGAAVLGHVEQIKAAVQAGCDVNTQDEYKRTALMHAAMEGHLEAVEALLMLGADPEIKDKNGENALMMAERNFAPIEHDLPLKKSVPEYQAIIKLLKRRTS